MRSQSRQKQVCRCSWQHQIVYGAGTAGSGVMSQKIVLFIITAVRNSNPICLFMTDDNVTKIHFSKYFDKKKILRNVGMYV
jgi:hypothetical protein